MRFLELLVFAKAVSIAILLYTYYTLLTISTNILIIAFTTHTILHSVYTIPTTPDFSCVVFNLLVSEVTKADF